MIHLTKNFNSNQSFENLFSILSDKKIKAVKHNFIYTKDLNGLSEEISRNFNTVSLTEIPFSEITAYVDEEKRHSDFGIVFKKDFVAKHAGNPVFYMLQQNVKNELRNIWDSLKIEEKVKKANFFIQFNQYEFRNRSKYDLYAKGREWRILGDLDFDYSDISFLLAPSPQKLKGLIDIFIKDPIIAQKIKQIPIYASHFRFFPPDFIEEEEK